jgi:O-antigen ligase
MLNDGFHQHFGGLEQSRKYFQLYVAPTLPVIPPEYLQKISSNRIFGTMFYPNSFAGAILLTLPVSIAFLSRIMPGRLRWFGVVSLTLACLSGLFWSGSKAGWLLMVVLAGIAILYSGFSKRTRFLLIGGLLLMGVTAFGLKYAGFFKKGATSVVARTDYWRAAGRTALEHPFLGTGPGTFGPAYVKVKAPEAEMTRLCHNDYLEQASDSGWIGAIAYAMFVLGGLFSLYRYKIRSFAEKMAGKWVVFPVWLGLFVFALHSFVEFHLYVLGLSYPFFILLGLLLGQNPQNPSVSAVSQKTVDKN